LSHIWANFWADAALDPGDLAGIVADAPAELSKRHLRGQPGAPHLAAEVPRRVAHVSGHPRVP
jgi:hypothetical protein